MKRLLAMVIVMAALAAVAPVQAADKPAATAAKLTRVPEPEVLRSIALADVKVGMRVKVQLTYSRPFVGMVTKINDQWLRLNLTNEDAGLPGAMGLRTKDIMVVWEVKSQTDAEKDLILSRRRENVARIKVEVAERTDKQKSEDTAEETREKTEAESIRQAMDVVVKKDDETKMRALLAEFPPEKWSEDMFRQVRENWILRDLQPTPEQSRFLTVFDDWKKARDTIAAIDAKSKDAAGEQLLIKFPPSAGWGKTRLDAIAAKQAEGAALTDEEAEFKTAWPDWSAAAQKRAADIIAKRAEQNAEETPAPKSEVAPETPAQETPAPEKAPAAPAVEPAPAPEKAPETPAVEPTPAPAPAPAPDAPEKAPDAPAPAPAPETPPAN